MTDTISNKQIILSLYGDCLNKYRFELLGNFISPGYTAVNGVKGVIGFRSTIDAIVSAFPDVQWHIEESIGEGDKVYIRWNFQGTHTGTFQQIAATGKKVSNTGMAVYTLKGGKVIATNVFTDRLSFLQQLGVLPVELPTIPGKSN
jgi:predicted ester cyclase